MQLCHISASFLEEGILQLNKMPLASGNLNAVFSPEGCGHHPSVCPRTEGCWLMDPALHFNKESSSTVETEFPTQFLCLASNSLLSGAEEFVF